MAHVVSSPSPSSPITVTFSLDRPTATSFLADLYGARQFQDISELTGALIRTLEAELSSPEAGRPVSVATFRILPLRGVLGDQ